jgi:CRISPR-associated protein Cas2
MRRCYLVCYDVRDPKRLREDQLLIVDLGSNEEAAREAATVLGQSLPDSESGMVVI